LLRLHPAPNPPAPLPPTTATLITLPYYQLQLWNDHTQQSSGELNRFSNVLEAKQASKQADKQSDGEAAC